MLPFLNYLRCRQLVQNNPIFRKNVTHQYNFFSYVVKGYAKNGLLTHFKYERLWGAPPGKTGSQRRRMIGGSRNS